MTLWLSHSSCLSRHLRCPRQSLVASVNTTAALLSCPSPVSCSMVRDDTWILSCQSFPESIHTTVAQVPSSLRASSKGHVPTGDLAVSFKVSHFSVRNRGAQGRPQRSETQAEERGVSIVWDGYSRSPVHWILPALVRSQSRCCWQ